MSETQEITLPILGDRLPLLPWIAWGGRHAGELDDLISVVGEWSAVPAIPLRPKWEISKITGDTIVGIIEDAPPFVQALTVAPTVEALQAAELNFSPALLNAFLVALPKLIDFLVWFTQKDRNVIEARFVAAE